MPDNTQKKGKRGGLRSTSWKPGVCPNPGGRPKTDRDFRLACDEHSIEALDGWVAVLRDPDAKDCDKIRAGELIVGHAGHAITTKSELSGPGGGPLANPFAALTVEQLRKLADDK